MARRQSSEERAFRRDAAKLRREARGLLNQALRAMGAALRAVGGGRHAVIRNAWMRGPRPRDIWGPRIPTLRRRDMTGRGSSFHFAVHQTSYGDTATHNQIYIERPGACVASFGTIADTQTERIRLWQALHKRRKVRKGRIRIMANAPTAWKRAAIAMLPLAMDNDLIPRKVAASVAERAERGEWTRIAFDIATPTKRSHDKLVRQLRRMVREAEEQEEQTQPQAGDLDATPAEDRPQPRRQKDERIEGVRLHAPRESTVARWAIAELPYEVSDEQREAILRSWCERVFTGAGVRYHAVIHAPEAGNDRRNYHAHIVYCPVDIEPRRDSRGNPTRGWTFEDRAPDWYPPVNEMVNVLTGNAATPEGMSKSDATKYRKEAQRDLFQAWRWEWARSANAQLTLAGVGRQYDPRSYKDQGLRITGGKHRGPIRTHADAGHPAHVGGLIDPEWEDIGRSGMGVKAQRALDAARLAMGWVRTAPLAELYEIGGTDRQMLAAGVPIATVAELPREYRHGVATTLLGEAAKRNLDLDEILTGEWAELMARWIESEPRPEPTMTATADDRNKAKAIITGATGKGHGEGTWGDLVAAFEAWHGREWSEHGKGSTTMADEHDAIYQRIARDAGTRELAKPLGKIRMHAELAGQLAETWRTEVETGIANDDRSLIHRVSTEMRTTGANPLAMWPEIRNEIQAADDEAESDAMARRNAIAEAEEAKLSEELLRARAMAERIASLTELEEQALAAKRRRAGVPTPRRAAVKRGVWAERWAESPTRQTALGWAADGAEALQEMAEEAPEAITELDAWVRDVRVSERDGTEAHGRTDRSAAIWLAALPPDAERIGEFLRARAEWAPGPNLTHDAECLLLADEIERGVAARNRYAEQTLTTALRVLGDLHTPEPLHDRDEETKRLARRLARDGFAVSLLPEAARLALEVGIGNETTRAQALRERLHRAKANRQED